MRIACPNCSAYFDVPEDAIPEEGRKLRCSQCQHKWHQLPIEENNELAFEDVTEDLPNPLKTEIELSDNIPIPSSEQIIETSRKGRLNVPWAPITIFAVLVLAISAGLNWRIDAVKQYPPIAILYDAIGLHVPVKGENLVLKNIGAWRNNEQFMEILLVQGEIYNPTELVQAIPIIQGTEIDATGRELQTEFFTPEAKTLLPDETIKFEFQKPFPDEKTVKFLVTFSDQDRGGDSGY